MADLSGQVAVITGATSGIGLATATGLADMGATTVILAHEATSGEWAAREIRRATRNPDVQVLPCDLSRMRDVRRVAARVQARFPSVDILVNNAGVFMPDRRRVTEDGFELHMAVQFFAPFLLTNLLLESMIASRPARVVNIAARYHRNVALDLEDLDVETAWSAGRANNLSKLCLVTWTLDLARRLEGTGVTANCLHPGAVLTGIQRHLPWWQKALLHTVARPGFVLPHRAAALPLYVATNSEMHSANGLYFEGSTTPVQANPQAYNRTRARELRTIAETRTGLRAGHIQLPRFAPEGGPVALQFP